jgi:predicted SAM-dependent methyltransferase
MTILNEKDFVMPLGRLTGIFRKRNLPSAAEAARSAAIFEELGNPGFITLAYQIILQRGVDPVGYDHFLPKLERKEITRVALVKTLFDSDEFRERCIMLSQVLHQSRRQLVCQLPKAETIVDLGGTCLEREEGALFVMGYPYPFKSLSIVDLPAGKRHKWYADSGTEHRKIVQTPLGPVYYVYTSMVDLSAFKNDSVDMVYSGQSIEHVTRGEADQVCREAWRVLKPGGWFCLDTPNRALTRIQFPRRFINPDHKYEYTHPELSGLLQQSGFCIQEAKGLVLLQESVRRGKFLESEFRKREGIYDDIENCYLLYYRCRKEEVASKQ